MLDHPALIVDDEVENLDLLERFLRARVRPVYRADNGEEALAILDRHRVDLILTDQRMPRMRGTDLLHLACERQPAAMRILVTAYGDAETLTQAINDGHIYQVVSKPIDVRMLEMVVKSALGAHQAAMRERELFEAFVFASVSAIEQRDPTTAGHSMRVAAMSIGLAMVVDGLTDGPYAATRFSRDDLDQLKYAALLHDFGKIGVREAVLVKSHKLPPNRLELFQYRLRDVDPTAAERLREMMARVNDPARTPREVERELSELGDAGLLEPEDIEFLRIDKGSLSDDERRAIQSHVVGTINFLRQLPWPARLSRVAEIAGAHHERLDGSGYPSGARDIPVEAQIMAICDVYDALVAADRPYKTAVSHERAVDILGDQARRNLLNPQLLEYFLGRRVYRTMRRA
jgi:response regulator RpfG family c-di-GMP phosphodiesterase